MGQRSKFLVFGATGQTGQHFVRLALKEGHTVRALARTPAKLSVQSPDLGVRQGSITEVSDLDTLVQGVDFVVAMLGDVKLQRESKIAAPFVRQLVPVMRRHGVKRFLYQAGGLTKSYKKPLAPVLWAIRNTLARGYIGQHEDNEAVIDQLEEEARDIEWIVHRAGIGSDGPSKGTLRRSETKFSVATFRDCADYSYRTVMDASAVHTCDLSRYQDDVARS